MAVGGEEAFAEFYATEYRRLAGALRLMVGDRATAEDLAQEAMVRAYRSWGRVEGMASPAGWLHRVGVNLVLRHRRLRRTVMAAREEPDEIGLVGVRVEIVTALRALPVDQRTAVVVRYVLGYSTPEAAVVLNRSEGAVRSLVHRAVVTMRAELSEDVR